MADIKERKKVVYDLHVDLTRALHELTSTLPLEKLEECAGAYLQIMRSEETEPLEVEREPLKQMATLAMYSLTYFLNRKYKEKK